MVDPHARLHLVGVMAAHAEFVQQWTNALFEYGVVCRNGGNGRLRLCGGLLTDCRLTQQAGSSDRQRYARHAQVRNRRRVSTGHSSRFVEFAVVEKRWESTGRQAYSQRARGYTQIGEQRWAPIRRELVARRGSQLTMRRVQSKVTHKVYRM